VAAWEPQSFFADLDRVGDRIGRSCARVGLVVVSRRGMRGNADESREDSDAQCSAIARDHDT
jgi:hypothetical protein